MDIISKRVRPRRRDAAGGPPPGPDGEVAWISDRLDPFGPRPACARALAPDFWDALLIEPEEEPLAGPLHRVRVEPDRQVRVVEATTGRRVHVLGEIRMVGRSWCFVLATRENGFRAALNSTMAGRLAQLDGARMGGPRTADTLSAEISSLLGYDAHR
ncbi:hypothetical protein [Amaricoccus solimangrovi]|uniref:Uncharacterized protein n=1 Tax=Amaricoccus solimangrovi TaxID=2589815 RepID=A0A501WVD4_9RHOB|nr:hypothetical protein [Amaricoccus solimangrovi]TPE53723.1 hypothetical protein FJM51_01355 [Amaricoccus solimangrovi]